MNFLNKIEATTLHKGKIYLSFLKTLFSLALILFVNQADLLGSEIAPIEQEENNIHSFEALMGKDSSAWKHIITPEDHKKLLFYKALYEQNKNKMGDQKIPYVFHIIWLGPETFPKASINNLKKWQQLHPHWLFKFWTDHEDREVPLKGMQKHLVTDKTLPQLLKQYDLAENFGEKAKILSYELLFQEGGIYIEHDSKPCQSFNSLSGFDFFCGLEELGPSIFSSSVIPAPHLMGASSQHPIFLKSIGWIKENWERLGKQYPGSTKNALYSRIKHRVDFALNVGIEGAINQAKGANIVFPSSYFSSSIRKASSYATHANAKTWLYQNFLKEKELKKEMQEIVQQGNVILWIVIGLSFFSLFGYIGVWSYVRSFKKIYE